MPDRPTIDPGLTHRRPRFNLADEPWIDVARADGSSDRVGLRALFLDANNLAGIAVSGPLTRFSLWRFLIALTHLIAPTRSNRYRDHLAAELDTGKGFDPARVDEIFDRYHDRLWLFHPEHPFGQLLNISDLADGAEPKQLNSVFVDVPGESSKAWFVRHDDLETAVSPADAAAGVLTRWFYGQSGNTSMISVAGETFNRTEGGRGLWGLRQITHVVRTGTNLYATLVANLDLATSTGHAIGLLDTGWVTDPAALATVRTDPLLASTITGVGIRLVDDDDGRVRRVVVGPAPLPKGRVKELLIRYSDNAPGAWLDSMLILTHTTRPGRKGAAGKTTLHTEQLSGSSDDLRTIHRYLHTLIEEKQAGVEVFGVVNSRRLVCGNRARQHAPRLEVLTIATSGTATVTYTDARVIDLDADLLDPDAQLAGAVADALDVIYGDRRAVARLRGAVRTALGADGAGKAPDVVNNYVERTLTQFLAAVDRVTREALETIVTRKASLSQIELDRFERRITFGALACFDEATIGLRDSSRFTASIIRARARLLSAIPKEMTPT